MSGFKQFLLRGNLVNTAIAFVVGAAFATLVKDFTRSFITPLIALFGGEQDYTELAFTVSGTRFPYGVFLNSAFAFLITAAVVYYFVVLPMTKLVERMDSGQEATERDCPECLGAIPLEARRCRFCTSEVTPVASPA